MFITSSNALLRDAKEHHYAIPAFNIHNLETVQSVVEVANEMRSPLILAATPSTVKYAGADYLYNIIKVAAEKSRVPIVYHLDHHESLEDMMVSVKLGCRSVMIDASHLTYEENIGKVKEVVEALKPYGITIEAELGRLVGQEDDLIVDQKNALYTDPKLAKDFVERTGIHALAVAIGTAHGLYKKTPKIDIDRLIAIQKEVEIPLVLHGASGLDGSVVQRCIKEGIAKVNIATELKIPFSKGIKDYFKNNPEGNDPRQYMTPGKEAMKDVVREKILMCQSQNRI